MSAFVLSSIRSKYSKRFLPSKALQDAKVKLGPAYFDIKWIECPQNAVELAKLRQSFDVLDKQKHKAVEENERAQRVLFHALQSRYTFSKLASSNTTHPSVRDSKLPPPGFRYHANGNPKLSLKHCAPTSTKFEQEEKSALDATNSQTETDVIIQSTTIDINQEETDEEIRTKSPITPPSMYQLSLCNDKEKNGPADTIAIDYEKELHDIEKIIRELDDELEKSKVNFPKSGTAREKALSFVRAHTRGCKELEMSAWEPSSYSRPNDRFPFQPGSSSFQINKAENLKTKKSNSARHSSCIACQFKLKHDKKDFITLQKKIFTSYTGQRWYIPPQGRMLESSSKRKRSSVKSNVQKSDDSSPSSSSSPRRVTKSAPIVSSVSGRRHSDNLARSRCASSSPNGWYRPKSPHLFDKTLDVLKSQQEEENLQCREKVHAFLKSLPDVKSKTAVKFSCV